MTEQLPQSIVDEDHALETSATKASEALASLRWHWTLNEGNPNRVSVRAYASAVGRAKSTIDAQANGYAAWLVGAPRPLNEAIERAAVSVEKETVIEAIADARGLSFAHVARNKPNDVKRVREIARERSERKGTPLADEAREVAAFIVKAEKAETAVKAERAARLGAGYINIEGDVLNALRNLQQAFKAAGDYNLPADEQELLRHTVNQVREMLQLLDDRISGRQSIDWDAELNAIMEGVS